jgi:hypothetical protein
LLIILNRKRKRQKSNDVDEVLARINLHLKIIDTLAAFLALLVGCITYSEGEKAFLINISRLIILVSKYPIGSDDTKTVEYVTTTKTDQYREAIILFTFLLGKIIIQTYI